MKYDPSKESYEEFRAREVAEERRQQEAFLALVQGVAERLAPLGFCWELQPDRDMGGPRHWQEVRHREGYGVSLATEWRRPERVVVEGVWPKDGEGHAVRPYELGQPRPEITVAISRGAQAVANEISRRFLPGYLELWQQAQATCDARDATKAWQAATRARFEQEFGLQFGGQEGLNGWPTGRPCGLDLRIGYNDVRVKLTLSADEAADVLRSLGLGAEAKP